MVWQISKTGKGVTDGVPAKNYPAGRYLAITGDHLPLAERQAICRRILAIPDMEAALRLCVDRLSRSKDPADRPVLEAVRAALAKAEAPAPAGLPPAAPEQERA
jgi:hypothetical protein